MEMEGGKDYEKVIQHDGVRTTVCESRYEIIVQPGGKVPEVQAVRAFKEWIRRHNEKAVRTSRDLSK
jgi:hypothetical protein